MVKVWQARHIDRTVLWFQTLTSFSGLSESRSRSQTSAILAPGAPAYTPDTLAPLVIISSISLVTRQRQNT